MECDPLRAMKINSERLFGVKHWNKMNVKILKNFLCAKKKTVLLFI